MISQSKSKPEFRFTGWHMLAILVAFFGVVIAVNLTMAVIANKSWTGLVVKNSYVASQKFNSRLADAREQKKRGWRSAIAYDAGVLAVTISDRNGNPLVLDDVKAEIGRPAFEQADHALKLTAAGIGDYRAEASLKTGVWSVRITGVASGVDYRRDARIFVRPDGSGVLQ